MNENLIFFIYLSVNISIYFCIYKIRNIILLMQVINRSGHEELFEKKKVRTFIQHAVKMTPELSTVDICKLTEQVKKGMGERMKTMDIAPYIAETASSYSTHSYHYSLLAGRVEVMHLHANTLPSFTDSMMKLKHLFKDSFVEKVQEYNYDIHIDHKKDFLYDIIGIRTLKRSYLLRNSDGIVERPQYMLMRVAVFLSDNIPQAIELYHILSDGWYTHATPTLYNAGLKQHQLASCFLMSMKEDSIDGIYDTLKDVALISKSAGGIGISVSNIRAKGTPIKGTNGTSNGLVPMLKCFNSTARYVDQGGGKRKGSFAIYIEPWHKDIQDVLKLKLNHGDENERARDLFYGLWIPDLFMKRVENDEMWTLFCPTDAPELQDAYGAKFDKLYHQYENNIMCNGTKIKARELWFQICTTQIETGTPYLLYKDACNKKSNQQNLGTIRSSNLCCEIIEYHSDKETAVCTLASIALPKFVTEHGFNFDKLIEVAGIVTENLNKVIDKSSYPTKEALNSNIRNRPIGIGVQGLNDCLQMLGHPFDSKEALELNRDIFETIYYGAVKKSIELAKQDGPYRSFEGSPTSKGLFQFDLWGIKPSGRFNWSLLAMDMIRNGIRNSLLTAPMPTASSAQILGNTESFEPRTSNMYVRRVLSGEYVIINKYLQMTCEKLGMWNSKLINNIMQNKGSVQDTNLPDEVKKVFKTSWEISQKDAINMAIARAPYIDQSQSLNLYLESPTVDQLTSMHFYAWKSGLKTGQYYLRTKPRASPVAFTVEMECESCSA